MAKKKSVLLDPHFLFVYVCAAALIIFIVYVQFFGNKIYVLEKKRHAAQQLLQECAADGEPTPEEIERIVQAYEKAISASPLSGQAAQIHFTIARLYLIHKEHDAAIDELEKVLLNFSKSAKYATEARFQIGKIYEARDQWDEAVAVYKDIYEYHPLSQKGLYIPLYIAERYKASGQAEQAKEAYDKAIKQYKSLLAKLGDISESSIVINYIALTYASQGQWKKAVEKWEGIVKDYPESRIVPATLMTLGEMYANRLKESSKAIERYTKVINEYEDADLARQASIRLIQLYFSTTDYVKAREWCQVLLEREQNGGNVELLAETTLLLARTHEKEGAWDEAAVAYDRVAKEYPDSAAAMRVPLIKAKHFQDGDKADEADRLYGEAMIEYQRIVAENPDTRVAVNAQDLMSLIYVNQKNWTGLIGHVDQLLGDSQGDPTSARHAQLLFLKANILNTKVKDKVAAREVYQQFLVTYPDHPLGSTVQKQIDLIDNPPADAGFITDEVSAVADDMGIEESLDKLGVEV